MPRLSKDARRLSAHALTGKLRDSTQHYILSLLSGSADLLSEGEFRALQAGRPEPLADYVERGYWLSEAEDKRLYRRAYLDFLDARDKDQVQIFFVPHYRCNFDCSYCYQDQYRTPPMGLDEAMLDAFFDHVRRRFAGRNKFITLFGGEPLLPDAESVAFLDSFCGRVADAGLELAVVSNGYHLLDQAQRLSRAPIKEIQLTLDGPPAVHDARRPLKGGRPTFERIAAGIDEALARNWPVNLRVVLDRENLESLPALAVIAAQRGWSAHPLFKTHLGRNYELHSCQQGRQQLYDRLELWREVYGLLGRHPEVLDFHRPAFSLSRFLADEGRLPDPLFDSCPGCKTEWAYDGAGRIYSCTATVGKRGEELGTFFPEERLDEERVRRWQSRDVTSIPACRDCAAALACGGGCAALAKNRQGDLWSPDCRPVAELLSLGLSLYGVAEENSGG